jgi:hypothetical protein
MEAAHSIGGQSVIHRDAPNPCWFIPFLRSENFSVSRHLLSVVARNDLGSREVAIKCLT